MKLSTLLFAAVATPALFAFALPADEVAFRVEDGVTLDKTFETTVVLTLDEMRMVANGEEQDTSMFGLEIDMTNASSLHFIDSYIKTEGGRAMELVRTFESLAANIETSQNNVQQGSSDLSVTSVSELEGTEVRFTWNEEEGEYDAAYADEDFDGDVELLSDLAGDADLRRLLPEGSVAKDDSWEVDASVILDLMSPGGDLKLAAEDVEGDGQQSDPMSEMSFGEMMGDVDGEITCTYKGLMELEGVNYASIEFDIDVTSSNDLTELMQTEAEEEQADIDMEFNSVDVEMAIEGTGTLLWDVRGGHFSTLEFYGEIEQIMDMSLSMSTPMGDMEMDQAITMSGSMTLDFSATKE